MGFERNVWPAQTLSGSPLSAAMTGIGMNFAFEAHHNVNIEDTLLFASIDGLEHDDLRVLSMLVTWLGIHSNWINADRLCRLVLKEISFRTRAFWAAFSIWMKADRRFFRLAGIHEGSRVDLLRVGTDFQIDRFGEDPRFRDGPLRVPANVLRHRPADVLEPEQLVRAHLPYRFRVILGPSYRADMWAALANDSTLSPAKLARRTYGSFATAWQVKRDWQIVTREHRTRATSLEGSINNLGSGAIQS